MLLVSSKMWNNRGGHVWLSQWIWPIWILCGEMPLKLKPKVLLLNHF